MGAAAEDAGGIDCEGEAESTPELCSTSLNSLHSDSNEYVLKQLDHGGIQHRKHSELRSFSTGGSFLLIQVQKYTSFPNESKRKRNHIISVSRP